MMSTATESVTTEQQLERAHELLVQSQAERANYELDCAIRNTPSSSAQLELIDRQIALDQQTVARIEAEIEMRKAEAERQKRWEKRAPALLKAIEQADQQIRTDIDRLLADADACDQLLEEILRDGQSLPGVLRPPLDRTTAIARLRFVKGVLFTAPMRNRWLAITRDVKR